jgi:hypothetical protein
LAPTACDVGVLFAAQRLKGGNTMSKLKTLLILVIAAGLAVFAALPTSEPGKEAGKDGERLFPGLFELINDVTTIVAVSGDEALTIKREGERWVVVERFSYDANPAQVRELLVGMSELKRIEAKTGNAKNYEKIEVTDPATGGDSIGYTLKTSDGAALAKLIVGKRQLITSSNDIDQYYVRVPEEARAWLVEGKVPKHRVATDWLNTEILKIAPERVHRTSVRHADGTVVRAVKAKPGMANFTLLGVAPGKEIKSDYDVHSLATALADITFNGVEQRSAVDFTGSDLQVVIETFDGLRVTVDAAKKAKDVYLRFAAEADPSITTLLGLTAGTPATASADTKPDASSESSTEKGPANSPPESSGMTIKTVEEIAQQVQALNKRWADWAYRVPTFNLDNIRQTVADLAQDPAPPAAPKSGS